MNTRNQINYRILGVLQLLVLVSLLLFSSIFLYFSPGQGNFLVLPWVYAFGLFFLGARCLQKAYGLASYFSALRYMFASLFAVAYPSLEISEGQKQISPDHEHVTDVIGGPAWLITQPGNAALLEDLEGKVRVVGSGRYFVKRQEIVKDAVSLRERDARVEKMIAVTKDGILVEARNVRYRYRILRKKASQKDKLHSCGDGCPFSEEAVCNMVYNRTLNEKGVIPWQTAVNFPIDSAITDYISQHFADDLAASNDSSKDARTDIYKKLREEGFRKLLAGRGAELTWIDIGHFEFPGSRVAEQRLDMWRTKWMGDADVERATGEAQRLAYQELGRAEAQAEMLISIVHALEDIGQQGEAKQNMRPIYLARIAQLLDAMRTHDSHSRVGRDSLQSDNSFG